MASRVAALLLLGVFCVGFASGEMAVDCCLSVVSKHLPIKVIVNYKIQEAGKGCDISATTFITKAGRKLCLPHPDDEEWVRNHIAALDKRNPRQQ
ncbi:C-C motif chemokine 19-like [Dicentrarchus labrax]|uniref:Chemokine interleukin-8-like domain-containing protein n=1 Tax=Dicentrarchus labrax TaxID=13489 RepID=A0A8C4EB36_DICLA|nr:C-C motif chemokine 19-like [Dicentrarchus labrax]